MKKYIIILVVVVVVFTASLFTFHHIKVSHQNPTVSFLYYGDQSNGVETAWFNIRIPGEFPKMLLVQTEPRVVTNDSVTIDMMPQPVETMMGVLVRQTGEPWNLKISCWYGKPKEVMNPQVINPQSPEHRSPDIIIPLLVKP